jgi:hypothetical protein
MQVDHCHGSAWNAQGQSIMPEAAIHNHRRFGFYLKDEMGILKKT